MQRDLIPSPRVAALATFVSAAACGHAGAPLVTPPRERYLAAVDARLDGDSQRYYDDIVALAHDSPDSREGRRARATLGPGSLVDLGVAAVLASAVVPSLSAMSARDRQREAQRGLRALASFQQSWRAEHGAFATGIPAAVAAQLEPRSYFYFACSERALAGPRQEFDSPAAEQARLALDALGLRPRLSADDLLMVALANLDQDPEYDAWVVEANGTVIHYFDDLP